METKIIFLPILAQIFLTLTIYIGLGKVRLKAVRQREVDLKRAALHDDAWPDYVTKFSNNIHNQFETPVLFYALALCLWALNAVSLVALIAAWGFVATRLIHVYIHTGSNYVPSRMKAFSAGVACLLVMAVSALHSAL